MLRLSALSLAILASACAIDDGPETSPGELTRVRDQAFACDDAANSPSWACSVDLAIEGNTVTTVGIHNDGSTNGPSAVGTLSETAVAELNALIATIPMSVEDGTGGIGCGAAPIASRTYSIDFETSGPKDLTFHSAEYGPLRELKNKVTDLITAIDTCQGNASISLSSCTPRVQPEQ
jgi:hypothetical protein